jgi:hypothetical protein
LAATEAGTADGFVSFGISTPSRHPANQNGYDPGHHRYRADYVDPKSWVLNLTFFPQGTVEDPPGRYKLPPDITAITWTVKLVDGVFSATIRVDLSSFRLSREVLVPQPGEYQISLHVDHTDGSKDTGSRNFSLRDFLIVGVGDSFASGQGNPDLPAVPAPDQKAFCKATSIALIASHIAERLAEFYRELKADTRKTIEYLPYAGKIAVALADGVDDVTGFVDKSVDYITNFGVQVGRDTETYIVDAGEEVLSWIGIGDGGDSDTPHAAAWQEPLAYRSYRSGQSLAAAKAETLSPSSSDRITFLAFGRTGSEISNGLLGPRTIDGIIEEDPSIDGWIQDRGQIQEARDTVAGRSVDAVIISIGINDLGFSSLVTNSILKASGEKRKNRINGAAHKIAVTLPAELDQLKKAIELQLKPRKVFITEYPIHVFKEIAEGVPPCGVLGSVVPNPATGVDLEGLNLDESDAIDLEGLGVLLNAKLSEKARDFGWIFISGIAQGCDGHGYCAKQSYFVSAEESCLNQGDFEGMFHPNSFGHEVTRDAIAQALHENLLAPEPIWLEPVMNMMMR